MNLDKKFKELADKLLKNEISLEEHLMEYNRLIAKETEKETEVGWQPHEHI